MDIQSCILSGAFQGGNLVLFILMICLILCSAFFSMSETAISSCAETKLVLAIEGKKSGAKNALYLYEHYDRTITTILIGNNLVNTALSTISVAFFATLLINTGINVELI